MDLFLEEFKVDDKSEAEFKDDATRKMYFIPIQRLGDFWNQYCEIVDSGERVCMTRILKKDTVVPLSFSINLQFDKNHLTSNRYNVNKFVGEIFENFSEQLIAIFQALIARCFNLTEGRMEMLAVMTRGDEIIDGENHIDLASQVIFPYATLTHEDAKEFYLNIATSEFNSKIHSYLANFSLPIISNDAYFSFPISDEWVLYGSSKNLSKPTMKLRCVYSEIFEDEPPLIFNVEDIISLEDNYLVKGGQIKILENEIIGFWTPYFLSPGFEIIPMKKANFLKNKKAKDLTTNTEVTHKLSKIGEVKELLQMISSTRLQKKCYWLDIGRALFDTFPSDEDSEEIISLWEYHTARAFKNQGSTTFEGDCSEFWDLFKIENSQKNDDSARITIKTLRWYAKLDSKVEYTKFHEIELKTLLFDAMNCQKSGPIGRLFRSYYEFDFLFDPKNKCWYIYDKHHWVECSDTVIYSYYDGFIQYLQELVAEYSQKTIQMKSSEYRTNNHNIVGLLNGIIQKVEGSSFKAPLKSDLETRYACEYFSYYCDRNPELFGCYNGVLDLSNREVFFRPGKPEDYISMYGASYMENFTYDHPAIRKASKYVSEVFVDPELRAFFWRYLGTCLRGGNDNKKIYNGVGAGDNSKTLIQTPIRGAFFMYYGDMPAVYLTKSSKNPNEADATMSYLVNKRYVAVNEPNPEEDIREGTAKKISGRDRVGSRDLYQKGRTIREVVPYFTMTVFTNETMTINSVQGAIWNRIVVIPFESCWVTAEKLIKQDGTMMTYEEQYREKKFLMDERIDLTIKHMGTAFLWMAVRGLEDYNKVGLNLPKRVIEESNNYRINSDIYLRFIKACVDKPVRVTSERDEYGNLVTVPDNSATTSVNDVYSAFRLWFKDEQIQRKTADKSTFIEHMEKKLGNKVTRDEDGVLVFIGIRLNANLISKKERDAFK